MGGWTFVQERLENLLPAASARDTSDALLSESATGSYSIHQKEQAELIAEALKHVAAALRRIQDRGFTSRVLEIHRVSTVFVLQST